jgi:4-hydroxybenzoate polyprenyltransferase
VKYLQVLEAIGQMRDSETALPAKGRPIDRSLGKKYVAAAAGILVCYSLLSSFLPYSASIGVVTGLAAIPVNILVLFLLLRARQYYQTSSESYLDDDPRQPILLSRSFVDDTPVRPA